MARHAVTYAGYEDSSRLYELPEGRIAVLPMVRKRVLGATLWEASFPPAWGLGGLIVTGGVRQSDLATMFEDLSQRRLPRTSLRPNPRTAQLWRRAMPPGVVVVPRLTPDRWIRLRVAETLQGHNADGRAQG